MLNIPFDGQQRGQTLTRRGKLIERRILIGGERRRGIREDREVVLLRMLLLNMFSVFSFPQSEVAPRGQGGPNENAGDARENEVGEAGGGAGGAGGERGGWGGWVINEADFLAYRCHRVGGRVREKLKEERGRTTTVTAEGEGEEEEED